MPRFIAAFLLCLIGSADVRAQGDWWDTLNNTPERLIGLLDLDDIVRGGCGPAPMRATARVFATPSQSGTSVGTIYWHEQADVVCTLMIERASGIKELVPTLESGYEIPAAIVFERRGSWYRIRLAQGSAWIARSDANDFLPYPEVLNEHLANILQGWDGVLRETPGTAGKVTPLSPGWKALLDRQLSVEYLGSRRTGNDLWINVRLGIEVCGQKHESVMPVSGWIPAYRSTRAPSAWFSSRGC